MPELIDLTNCQFGELTVLFRAPSAGRVYKWYARCNAGSPHCKGYVLAVTGNLIHGLTRSCRPCSSYYKRHLWRHGKYYFKEYGSWRNMVVLHKGQVCDRWLTFPPFFEDLGMRPSGKTHLIRPDQSKPYGPGNCFWGDHFDLSRSRRDLPKVEIDGRFMSKREAARLYKMPVKTFENRLRHGWPIELALRIPRSAKKLRRAVQSYLTTV